MNATTIIRLSAVVVLTTVFTDCKTAENTAKTPSFSRFDAPRGQIGHVCKVQRPDAPCDQIGQTYAINNIPMREHLLPVDKHCV